MELKRLAVQGVFWSGTRIWGTRAVTFIVFAILSRLLTPETFGLIALAYLFITFAQTFQDQGFGDAIVQRADLKPEHLDTAFWTNLGISAALALISIAGAGLISELFHEPELAPIIRWLSLGFVFSGLIGVQQAIVRRQLEFRKLALAEILALVISGGLAVALAILGFGVWSLVVQDLVNLAVVALVLWVVSDWRPGFHFSRVRFAELSSFGLNIIGINVLNFVNMHTDDLLIGYFLGPTLLGFYTVAYKLFGITKDLLTSVTNAVAFPVFSRLQDDPDRMRQSFYKVVRFTSLISFPAFIGMSVLAPQLIPALFGPQWTLSIPVLQVLAIIGILHSMLYYHDSFVYALGKPAWRLAMIALNAVSNVIAFAIAVRWGIVAVAAAYVIRGYLLSPLEFWMVSKLGGIDVKIYLRQLVVPAIASLLMAATVFILKTPIGRVSSLQVQVAVCVILGCGIYAAVVQLLAPRLRIQLLELLHVLVPARFFPRTEKL